MSGISRIYMEIFCLTVRKNFVEEPFCVSQSFWYRKKLWIRGEDRGSITIFRQKFFVTVPRIFVGEPLSALLISGIEKFHAYEWNITNFYGNFLPHSTKKFCWGTLLCFTKFLVSKKLMDKGGRREGVSRFSFTTFFSHSARNFRRGTLQCFLNFVYGKILCL